MHNINKRNLYWSEGSKIMIFIFWLILVIFLNVLILFIYCALVLAHESDQLIDWR